MHLERPFLGKYFTAGFAHKTDVMSSQAMLIQLKFQGKGVIANATLEWTITAVICRDVIIQRRNIAELPVAVLAWELRLIATESLLRPNAVFFDLVTDERRPRPELKAANFAKRSRFRVFLSFTLF